MSICFLPEKMFHRPVKHRFGIKMRCKGTNNQTKKRTPPLFFAGFFIKINSWKKTRLKPMKRNISD